MSKNVNLLFDDCVIKKKIKYIIMLCVENYFWSKYYIIILILI